MPYYYRDPKRDHNFDNHPGELVCCGIALDDDGVNSVTGESGFDVGVSEN